MLLLTEVTHETNWYNFLNILNQDLFCITCNRLNLLTSPCPLLGKPARLGGEGAGGGLSIEN